MLERVNPADCRRVGTRTGGGRSGASERATVRRLREETVARRRKAVSMIEHRLTGWHRITDRASGIRRAALEPSTIVPWIRSPEDHLP